MDSSILEFGLVHLCIQGFPSEIKNRMANETAHYEPSHRDLHCLHRYWFWSVRLRGLRSLFCMTNQFSFIAEMLASLNRPAMVNNNRERRTRYQHPKGAPDADAIFGSK